MATGIPPRRLSGRQHTSRMALDMQTRWRHTCNVSSCQRQRLDFPSSPKPWQPAHHPPANPQHAATNPSVRSRRTMRKPRLNLPNGTKPTGHPRRQEIPFLSIASRHLTIVGPSAMTLGLRNITNAFHMCRPVILHAAMTGRSFRNSVA